jgi:plastocyanin
MHTKHKHTQHTKRFSSAIPGRVIRGAAVGVVLTGLFASTGAAVTNNVEATEDKTFLPSAVATTAGNSVHWFGTAGGTQTHSVHQDAGLFDSGNPQTGLNFTRVFSAGTFGYHCEKHGTLTGGMRGQVSVAPQVLTSPAGLAFTVKWASSASNTGTRFDVQYRVGSGTWKSWKANTTARSAVFGAKSLPVKVVAGKGYSFRVVSRLGTAKSGVSPIKAFTAR